jgi:hypothetical protein
VLIRKIFDLRPFPDLQLRIGQRATLLRDRNSRTHGILTELTHGKSSKCIRNPAFALIVQKPSWPN